MINSGTTRIRGVRQKFIDQLSSGGGTVISFTCVKQRVLVRGQEAWKTRELHLHGWVYGINSGLITDLKVIHDTKEDIEDIYRLD